MLRTGPNCLLGAGEEGAFLSFFQSYFHHRSLFSCFLYPLHALLPATLPPAARPPFPFPSRARRTLPGWFVRSFAGSRRQAYAQCITAQQPKSSLRSSRSARLAARTAPRVFSVLLGWFPAHSRSSFVRSVFRFPGYSGDSGGGCPCCPLSVHFALLAEGTGRKRAPVLPFTSSSIPSVGACVAPPRRVLSVLARTSPSFVSGRYGSASLPLLLSFWAND